MAAVGKGRQVLEHKMPYPRLPVGVEPRICRWGMKCSRADCSYIHVKPRSGKSLNALGFSGVELVSDIDPASLTWDGGLNCYILDDEGDETPGHLGLVAEGSEAEISAEPLGILGCLGRTR